MIDPELADTGVSVAERVAVDGHRVREERGVEVDARPVVSGPVDPTLKMTRFERVALDALPSGLGIDGVKVEPMTAGDQGKSLLQIRTQLVGRSRFARIIARDGQPPAQGQTRVLEASNIIPLPAVERHGDRCQRLENGSHVDTNRSVTLDGQLERGGDSGIGSRHGRLSPEGRDKRIDAL